MYCLSQHNALPTRNITHPILDIVEEEQLQLALPQDARYDIMCAHECVNMADENHVIKELTIQELVRMVTASEGEDENEEEEERVDFENPVTSALLAQSYLHELYRYVYFSNDHILQQHVSALIDIAQAAYRRQAELSKQTT